MKTYKKSLAQFVLLVLEKAIDGYVYFDDFAHHHYRYLYGYPKLEKASLAAAIRRLRLGGLIEVDKDSSEMVVKLTELGKDALGDLTINDQQWDGKWRIVIFDIPEKRSIVRNLFRRRLKEWGFKNWQRSVWVSKNNVTDKLRAMITKIGMEKWVAVIESSDPTLSYIL